MTQHSNPDPTNLYTYRAQLVRVIDGDTYALAIDLGFDVTITRHIRLAAIDCPERGTAAGLQTTIAAARWFAQANGEVVIQSKHYDRYGRTIATVTNPTAAEPDLAAYLLKQGCHKWTGRK